jgi:hypothetical protein
MPLIGRSGIANGSAPHGQKRVSVVTRLMIMAAAATKRPALIHDDDDAYQDTMIIKTCKTRYLARLDLRIMRGQHRAQDAQKSVAARRDRWLKMHQAD